MRLHFRARRRRSAAPLLLVVFAGTFFPWPAWAQTPQQAPSAATALPTAPAAAPEASAQSTSQVVIHAAWDTEYIYFAFQVDDSDVTGTNTRPLSHPEQDDSIGVYFQTGAPTDYPDAHTHALIVSAAQGFTLLDGDPTTKSFVVPAKPNFGIKYGVSILGTLNHSDDSDKGYVVTLAVPMDMLGLTLADLKAGTTIAFNAVVRSRNAKTLTALAPTVKTEADVAIPSRWGKLTLLGPTGAGAAAGLIGAVQVDSKASPPLIDGTYRDTDWSAASKISFASPDVAHANILLPTAVAATKTSFAAIDAKAPALDLTRPITGLPTQILALYQPDYQADLHKIGISPHGVFGADGTVALADDPVGGVGPWFSGDRVSYHRNELATMHRDGIDIALVEIGGPDGPRGPEEEKAVLTMVTALRELAASGTAAPRLALCLDLSHLGSATKVDFSQAAARATVYSAILRWTRLVPPELRARFFVPAADRGRIVAAYPIFLRQGNVATGLSDTGWADELRDRFAADFGIATAGTTLLFAGIGADWQTAGGIAASVPSATGAGAGAVATYLLQPGTTTGRHAGDAFRSAWESVVGAAPTWIVLDSWNDFADGTEIASSRQYGSQFEETNRLYAIQTGGLKEQGVRWLGTDAPRRMAPGEIVATSVTLQNIGREVLSSTLGYTIAYRWRHNGEVVAESPLQIQIGHPLLPTTQLSQSIGLAAASIDASGHLNPLPPGDYTVEFDIEKSDDGGKTSTLLSVGGNAAPLRVPVSISNDLPDQVEIADTTLPAVVRGGENIPTMVRLRWMGANPLALGEATLVAQVVSEDGKTAVTTSNKPLPSTLQPGQWISVPITVQFAAATVPIPPANPQLLRSSKDAPSSYTVRYLLTRTNSTETISGEYDDHVAVYPADDDAVVETPASPPTVFDAAARVGFNVRVTNNGTKKWAKGSYAIGYHWYNADGQEADWKPALSAVFDKDVAPGGDMVVRCDLRTPDHEGDYILALDVLRLGDQVYLSTLPGGRAANIGVVPIHVAGGNRLTSMNLDGLFTLDAVSSEAKPAAGDLDGAGHTLPAESFPPDQFGIVALLSGEGGKAGAGERVAYPSGYYFTAEANQQQITFRYGQAAPGAKNAIRCAGQTIPLPRGKCLALHIAATATGGAPKPLPLTFHYHDGTTQVVTATVPDWMAAPGPGDIVAATTHLKRGPTGDIVGPCNVWHLIYATDAKKTADSVTLGADGDIKVFAITVERY